VPGRCAVGNLVGHVTSLLTSVPAPLALTIIGALVFAEAALFVGFVLPGETAVLFGGALAAGGHLSFPELVVVVVVAAIVGDSVGYEVGRRFGPRLLETRPLRRHRARIEVARTRLRDKGAVTVVAGRFTALLRAVTPGLCGMSRMPYRRFLLFNAAGGLAWGTAVCVLGFVAGKSYQRVESSLGAFGAVLLLLFVIAGIVAWHRGRAAKQEAALSDDEAGSTPPEA
jgi:membrane-associated protein